MTTPLSSLRFRAMLTAFSMASAPPALAAVFDGPGLQGGTAVAGGIDGPAQKPLRAIIIDSLKFVLNFLALAGVVMVVIAGLYLIFSNGDDAQKDKAKNIIKYVIIGLIVVLFARLIVSFFTQALPAEIS